VRKLIWVLSKKVFVTIIACGFIILAVGPVQFPLSSKIDWKYSDLKAIDPPDEITPEADLIAVYFRESGRSCEIRLDLLASSLEVIPEAYFLIDYLPGGQNYVRIDSQQLFTTVEWEFAIRLLPNDSIQIIETDAHIPIGFKKFFPQVHAIRNLDQDTIEIQFDCDEIGSVLPHAKVAIVLVDSSQSKLTLRLDQSIAINLDGSPPNPANILMLFTESFSGNTPAQSIKNWDGAHTGPGSARHGLAHLVNSVDIYRMPVFLVDLKTPQNLSALDAIGVLNDLVRLDQEGLLILPDYSFIRLSSDPEFFLPANIYSEAFLWSRLVSKEMGLATTPFFSATEWPRNSNFPNGYKFFLPKSIPVLQNIRVCKTGQTKYLCSPLPQYSNFLQPNIDVDLTGLTIDARKALVQSAMRNKGEMIVLGGALNQSAWGNIGVSKRVFKYFQNHPWINPLNSNDLLTWTVSPDMASKFLPSPAAELEFVDAKMPVEFSKPQMIVNQITEILNHLPANAITTFAHQSFYALLSANNSSQHKLNAASLGQIGHLIYAAKWASAPKNNLTCGTDINWDGINECIFSTKNLYGSFDTIGGAMVSAFALTDTGIQQIATSSYQVANGLSDPFRWKPSLGIHGDPDAPGAALVEMAYAEKEFLSRIEGNSLFFESQDGIIKKEIRLFADRIRIDYQLASPQVIQFQSSLNPWERFKTNWTEISHKKIILTNMKSQASAYSQPLPYLNGTEDPNFDYGRGFFTLFPFETFTFQGYDKTWLEILGR